MALQPGKGKVDGRHYLPSTPETVRWGQLPNAATRPVLTVDSGTTVTFDTVSQEGILEDQGRDPDAFFARFGVVAAEVLDDARAIAASGMPHRFGIDGPHIVTGPVHVRDTRPGDVLEAEIVSLHPRARYGIVSARHGLGLLAGEFPEGDPPDADADARRWQAYRTSTTFFTVERRRGKLFGMLAGREGPKVRFPLSPFLGIMAVGADGTEPLCSTSLGAYGGALDCRDIGMGARLFLPVQVPGALFAVGDPHYALGDGKVAFTALEGPLRATVRLTGLRDGAARAVLGALREPFVETDTTWMTIGIDADLTEALRRSTRSAVVFLQSKVGLDKAAALAYLSSAAEFGLCQVVNGMHSAYCRLRRDDFSEPHVSKPRLPRPGFARIGGSGDSSGTAASDAADAVAPEAAVPDVAVSAVRMPEAVAPAAVPSADPEASLLGTAEDDPAGVTVAERGAAVAEAEDEDEDEANDSSTDHDGGGSGPAQPRPSPAVAPKQKQAAGRVDRLAPRRRRTRPK